MDSLFNQFTKAEEIISKKTQDELKNSIIVMDSLMNITDDIIQLSALSHIKDMIEMHIN